MTLSVFAAEIPSAFLRAIISRRNSKELKNIYSSKNTATMEIVVRRLKNRSVRTMLFCFFIDFPTRPLWQKIIVKIL